MIGSGSRRRRAIMFQDEEHAKRTRSSNIVAFGEKRERESSNEDEQHSPTKRKGRSSTQEGRLSENGSTSTTNVSSMPGRHVLEFVLDLLQRNDPEELFAETDDHNVDDVTAEGPMDFTTMRGKLHMGMYTSMEEFKLDVYLMCTSAMDAYPADSRHYIVAEAINTYAKEVFEDLSGPDPVIFQLEPSLKRPSAAPGRKTQGGQPRTTEHAKFRRQPAGNTTPETEKRDNYWLPNDKSLFSRVSDAQPYIQLNEDGDNYEDNLCLVEDLEPTAERVGMKNLLGNVSGTQHTPQQAPAEPDVHELSLDLSLSNMSSTISENRIVNTIGSCVNIVQEGSNACAAALLGNVYLNKNKRETNNRQKDEKRNSNENVLSVQQGVNQNLELRLGIGQGNNHVSSTSRDANKKNY